MLLANMAVSHKIYDSFPDHAVLRRHPPPQSKMVADLQQVCAAAGVDIDVTSAKAIQASLMRLARDGAEREGLMSALTAMASKPMQVLVTSSFVTSSPHGNDR